jgi:hypothetical protein
MDKESRRAIIQVILENLGAEGGELLKMIMPAAWRLYPII